MMAAATMTSTALAALLLCAAAFLAAHATDGHHQTPEGDDLVAKVCANVTSRDLMCKPQVTREFCDSALRSDKRSAAAKHPRDLALVAIDLFQRGAADADAKVDGAIRSGSGRRNWMAFALRYCRVDYADVAGTVPVCRAIIQEYKDGDESDDQLPSRRQLDCADRMSGMAFDCAARMHDGDGDGELSKEVNEAFGRSCLVSAMVEKMLGVGGDDDQ
ncbi:uncharacterized protein LOC133925830 [Phragmites australis]|uniref:uncharacterized protein LOC133925830 n=1 Tax=Phragmites australis TaxID=29695 RepID=UPI002D76F359|nr:uncharacterized protein LOC133925830 [Phragmites australis]